MVDRTVRQARPEDHEAVAAFTEGTWDDRDVGDYIPEVFPEWVETDGPAQHTVVTELDGTAVGLAQARMLTDDEAWLQGLRVHPDHRGQGHAGAMTDALLAWCRDRGATAARNMVFGWNGAGMGQSRAAGLAPGPACRWARPDPAGTDAGEHEPSGDLTVTDDRDAAWRYWTHGDARGTLSGLALDDEETWALAELTRGRFEGLADAGRAIAIIEDGTRGAGDGDGTHGVTDRRGTRAMTVRRGTRDRDGETVVDYAVAAWADADAARALFDAIRADAADCDAEGTRVLIPETPRHVSDAALARASLSDYPVYTFVADLSVNHT